MVFTSKDLLLVYGQDNLDMHRFVHVYFRPKRLFVGYALVGRSGSASIMSNPYCDDCLNGILQRFCRTAYQSKPAEFYRECESSMDALQLTLSDRQKIDDRISKNLSLALFYNS